MEDRSQKAVVLKLRGAPDSKITLTLTQPVKRAQTFTLRDLADSSEAIYTGDYPRESGLMNRIVVEENYRTSFQFTDQGDGAQTDWYYVRVVQANGQLAWSSPIWVEKKS